MLIYCIFMALLLTWILHKFRAINTRFEKHDDRFFIQNELLKYINHGKEEKDKTKTGRGNTDNTDNTRASTS